MNLLAAIRSASWLEIDELMSIAEYQKSSSTSYLVQNQWEEMRANIFSFTSILRELVDNLKLIKRKLSR